MQGHPLSRQRGLSLIGLLLLGAVFAGVGLVGAQAFPTVVEFVAIKRAVEAAKTSDTMVDVRSAFDKAATINDIKSISGKDLIISGPNGNFKVSFAYNKEIPLFEPAYLLIKYEGHSK